MTETERGAKKNRTKKRMQIALLPSHQSRFRVGRAGVPLYTLGIRDSDKIVNKIILSMFTPVWKTSAPPLRLIHAVVVKPRWHLWGYF